MPSGREWNKDLITMMFSEEDKRDIEEIRPRGAFRKDVYTWDYPKSGQYSVKSGYWVLTKVVNQKGASQEVRQPSLDVLYQQVWKTETSPKIQHFLWKCLSNIISVAGNLSYRHILRDAGCSRCPSKIETVNHLLFQCSFARLVWALSPIPAPPGGEWSGSLYANMFWILIFHQEQPQLINVTKLTPWIAWRIWKNRNDLVFKGIEYKAPEVLNKAEEDAEEWEK